MSALNSSENPSRECEDLDVRSYKQRKIWVGGKVVGQAGYTQPRAFQAAANAVPGSRGAVLASEGSSGDNDGGQPKFKSREDVEKFLAEKLNPRNRNNDKGRNKELREKIRKLRTCVNWLLGHEDGYLAEQEKLRCVLESEQRSRFDIEAHMTCKIDEQKDKTSMMEILAGLRDQSSYLKNQLDTMRLSQQEATKQSEEFRKEVGCLRSELLQVRVERDRQFEHIQCMIAELKKYDELSGKSSRDMDIALIKDSTLENTCSSQQDQIKMLHYELTTTNEKLKRAGLTSLEIMQENEGHMKLINELQSHVADLESQLVDAEKLRKKLHNTILDLKGNIRVFCRVRPVLSDIDCKGADGTIISYPTSVEYLGRGIDLIHNARNHSFTFDKVFGHEASQEDVFFEISQLVQSALDGHKVCIFAYGQSGSGKTYTMMGKPEAHEKKGLIPRSLEQIFETSQALKHQGWQYKMQVSMLEIYNETIRDLLSPSRFNNTDAASFKKKYTINHDSAGNTLVSDLSVVDVCSLNEVSFLLNQAAQNRSVGKTQMNEQSSRSHFVFTLRISGKNNATEQQVQGVLNLIDLAGSERLAKSGSTGDCLKETQAINKSLSSLSDVIFAIAKKEDHVPYRNSKLTHLLQPCLGGDSKTLMFVNISPEPSSAFESICSLRFAVRVNACEIGVPRRRTQTRALDSRHSYG